MSSLCCGSRRRRRRRRRKGERTPRRSRAEDSRTSARSAPTVPSPRRVRRALAPSRPCARPRGQRLAPHQGMRFLSRSLARKRGREEEGGARAAPGARAHARLRAHPMVVSQGRQRRPVGRGRTTPAPRGARRVCRPCGRPPPAPRPRVSRCALKKKPRCCPAKAVIPRVHLHSGAMRAPSHRPALRAPKSHPAKRTAPGAQRAQKKKMPLSGGGSFSPRASTPPGNARPIAHAC